MKGYTISYFRGGFCVIPGPLGRVSVKRESNHPLAIYKRMRAAGVTVTPYETTERRVVGRKIVNVEYHKIDWAKNFAAAR